MAGHIGEAYLDHYDKFLGNFVDVHKYERKNAGIIQFLEYRNVFEGCKTRSRIVEICGHNP